MTPDEIARASAEAMLNADRATGGLGMCLDAVAPGTATISMTATEAMTNGHDICHGGLIFALADSAFAFACNSYDARTVARRAAIAFLAPARVGDGLTAVER